MPELPEVETVMRGLQGPLTGRRLTRVTQRRADLRWPLPENFAARLQGRRVERMERRAKYILAHLDDGMVWLIHLGMSGRIYIGPGPAPPAAAHEHVTIETDGGHVVRYEDARRFGMMDLVPGEAAASHRLLAGLGPEPLGNAFNDAVLSAALAGKKTPIKAALLDQTIVAGLGNIYVCEALFRAQISPRRLAHTVAGRRAIRLVPAIRDVLTQAIAAGGSTLRDYVQASGELGYFQHAFQVYDREGKACIACTRPIRRIVQSGRSSFFCGHCQR